MSEKDLKPCPFCGGPASINADPEAVKDTHGRFWAYNVVCNKCCATSGLTFSTDRATVLWNRRAHEA